MLLPRRASKGQGIHISSRPALSPDRDPTLHAARCTTVTAYHVCSFTRSRAHSHVLRSGQLGPLVFRCLYEMQCDSHPHRFSLTASRGRSALAAGPPGPTPVRFTGVSPPAADAPGPASRASHPPAGRRTRTPHNYWRRGHACPLDARDAPRNLFACSPAPAAGFDRSLPY